MCFDRPSRRRKYDAKYCRSITRSVFTKTNVTDGNRDLVKNERLQYNIIMYLYICDPVCLGHNLRGGGGREEVFVARSVCGGGQSRSYNIVSTLAAFSTISSGVMKLACDDS